MSGPAGRTGFGSAPIWRAAGAGALSAACGVGLLATSGWLITRASQRPPVFALSVAIGAVQAFALGRGVARYFERLSVHGLALQRLGALRLQLYDALEPRVPGGLPGRGAGAVVAGFVSDAEVVADGDAKRVTAAIDLAASVLAGVLVAGLVAPVLGAVLLAGATAVVLAALVAVRAARRGAAGEAALRAELAAVVVDTMQAAPELVAYGRADLLDERLGEVRRRALSAAWRRALAVGAGRAAAILLAGGGLLALVGVGLSLQDRSRLPGVLLAAATFAALAVLDQMSGLVGVFGDVAAGAHAAGRLARLVESAPVAPEPPLDAKPPRGPLSATLTRASVTLGGRRALSEVSLSAPPGRRVVLQGASGAGKTTVLHALLHFVATSSGEAALGGVDVSTMRREGLAHRIGWLADDTYLFAASLGDNLRLARPEATDAQLETALERAGLRSWRAGLDEGLETLIGAGGRPVSAGERQRLGVARTLLAGGSVLLLDEPTAHIDPASAPALLAGILESAGERAVLLVSHDPDAESLVDEVVTLDGGVVVARRAGGRGPR